jgi:two-component system phosphate regulon response regulator PhoB
MQTILVVDDETDILDLVTLNLERTGFQVVQADNGNNALTAANKSNPDLIVLDIMMPGKDGTEVLKELRADGRTKGIPVIMLTAKGELNDRIAGLELGADDYLSKPFSPKELILRIKALLKRTNRGATDANIRAGDFLLDRNNLRVFIKGAAIDVTATEFKLLRLLIDSNGNPVDRDVVLREVWGYSDNALTRTLDTHIKRLREKLGDHAEHVQTVRGVGYRFVANLEK